MSQSRKKEYCTNRWQQFREELIELDGRKCVRCGRAQDEGTILQIHHKKYLFGRKPWEYPYDLCETLCKRCHAEEHGKVRPESGWEYVGDEDLGGLYGVCDRCNTEIRYVFYIQHPNWEPMSVGTVCCDDLTGTKEASEKRKYEERRNRFIKSKRWQHDGSFYSIKQRGFKINITKTAKGYIIEINNIRGKKFYSTLDEAKLRVFEFIESGEADKFFDQKS